MEPVHLNKPPRCVWISHRSSSRGRIERIGFYFFSLFQVLFFIFCQLDKPRAFCLTISEPKTTIEKGKEMRAWDSEEKGKKWKTGKQEN